MGWSIGWDNNWKRDIGYGVPAMCDAPDCSEEIDRGLGYVCGGQEPYGGEYGCGLYFCSKHSFYHKFRGADRMGEYCKRCVTHKPPYDAKPDIKEWVDFKNTDPSWAEWREKNGKAK